MTVFESLSAIVEMYENEDPKMLLLLKSTENVYNMNLDIHTISDIVKVMASWSEWGTLCQFLENLVVRAKNMPGIPRQISIDDLPLLGVERVILSRVIQSHHDNSQYYSCNVNDILELFANDEIHTVDGISAASIRQALSTVETIFKVNFPELTRGDRQPPRIFSTLDLGSIECIDCCIEMRPLEFGDIEGLTRFVGWLPLREKCIVEKLLGIKIDKPSERQNKILHRGDQVILVKNEEGGSQDEVYLFLVTVR